MSNPWAKSFEELRAPYLAEKKAKKDYDGDGEIESGTDEYKGSVDKAIKKSMAMKGKKKVAEHHTKDKDGNTIPHGDGSPSSVEEMKKFGPGGDPIKKPGFIDKALDKLKKNTPVKKLDKAHYEPEEEVVEAKVDKTMTASQKRAARNERQMGKKDKPFRSLSKQQVSKQSQKFRRNDIHEPKRGVKKEKGKMTLQDRAGKGRGMTRDNQLKNIMNKSTSVKKVGNNVQFSHYEPEGELVNEADKKGKGSGKKDACYKKVKAGSDVWPSAYASGRLVQCRKVGAANYGNSKKEEFDFRIKSFDELVGECWKTHKQVGTKMKGGKVVPNCVPKNEEFVGEEGINKDPAFDIMRPGGKNSPYNEDGTKKKKETSPKGGMKKGLRYNPGFDPSKASETTGP